MKKILMYWPNFFIEALFTIKYYRAVKSIKAELEKENLRVDWIGRIYTVVNLKEEFLKQPEVVNKILIKYGLSNDAFPEISKLSAESYLVVLYPENDDFNMYSFIRNLLFLGLVAGAVYGIVQLVNLFI